MSRSSKTIESNFQNSEHPQRGAKMSPQGELIVPSELEARADRLERDNNNNFQIIIIINELYFYFIEFYQIFRRQPSLCIYDIRLINGTTK